MRWRVPFTKSPIPEDYVPVGAGCHEDGIVVVEFEGGALGWLDECLDDLECI